LIKKESPQISIGIVNPIVVEDFISNSICVKPTFINTDRTDEMLKLISPLRIALDNDALPLRFNIVKFITNLER
jgi:hypothetical protein